MARFECSICALSPVHLAAIENELHNGVKFRDLAQASGLSKSALHRHWTNCVHRRRLAELKQRRAPADYESRTVVSWPDGSLTLNGLPFDGKFTEHDILLRVAYKEVVIRELGNPTALITQDLLDEAASEHRERFPSATIATEEVSRSHDATVIDAAPCEVGERESRVQANLLEVTAAENQGSNRTLKKECEHVWRDVAAGIKRCIHCAEQRNDFQVTGISRKEFEKRNQRGQIRGMGRFG
jgi:hypothetical protein